MADSSLDQFFAKKDKSKKKAKGKVTSEQIAKKMEDSGKPAEKTVKKDKDKQENSSGKLSITIPSLAQSPSPRSPPAARTGRRTCVRGPPCALATSQGPRRPVRENYDFTSEEQFPTLGAAVDAKAPRRVAHSIDAALLGPFPRPEYADHSFTSVKHGLRNREDPTHHHLQLDLENKYSALHQTDGN
ncbi:hypothetical protein HPB48_018908 [Haemaphysalis longicornis]|uniref:Uncharacterized protein n=1 Tax=Haemaphysalis longicornis TaxID=44386 RepID=A0A9J6G2J2_HAELO|nr:hypothetical protein HPB48_018908 [Haemaphysalis longicornis]